MANFISRSSDCPPESPPSCADRKMKETDDMWNPEADDDGSFHCRRMTHPGTSRHPFSRPRLSLCRVANKSPSKALSGERACSQASLGSNGHVWVVQVSPTSQPRKENQESETLSKESNEISRGNSKDTADTNVARSLEKTNAESRAVQLLPQELKSSANAKVGCTTGSAKPTDEPDSSSDTKSPSETSDETMLSGMAPFLMLGQCFSLMAVSNVAGRHGKPPQFRWLSFRMVFSVTVSSLLGLLAILALIYLISRNEFNLGSSQMVGFYLSSFVASCTYVRLASRWASVCSAFEEMESRISFYGNSAGLRRKMRGLTAFILVLAVAEHGLAQLNTIVSMQLTMANNKSDEWLFSYFEGTYRHVHQIMPYHPVAAVACIMLNITATFIWNYNDLFIMLMSIAISNRFRILNRSLIETAHEEKDSKTWQRARETFNSMASLTRTVDRSLSLHVLVSFVNNFYFICLQLLHTVRHDENTVYSNIYFSASFGFLLLRAVAVSLFGAEIYDQSCATKRALYAVSSNSYCDEVDRFLVQVTTDEVALTGSSFFKVTRSILLTLVGTITTYEVVLVQFNALKSKK